MPMTAQSLLPARIPAGSDGAYPRGQVILDADGNVYKTTTAGGLTVGSYYQNLGCGVVWEITP